MAQPEHLVLSRGHRIHCVGTILSHPPSKSPEVGVLPPRGHPGGNHMEGSGLKLLGTPGKLTGLHDK